MSKTYVGCVDNFMSALSEIFDEEERGTAILVSCRNRNIAEIVMDNMKKDSTLSNIKIYNEDEKPTASNIGKYPKKYIIVEKDAMDCPIWNGEIVH